MKSKTGINRTHVKESNLAQIIRQLHFNDDCTRVSLSHALGLTQPAITKLVNKLMQSGLVVETSSIDSGKGRRPIALKVNGERYLLLAGRINRDYISAAMYDLNGKLHAYCDEQFRPVIGARECTIHLRRLLLDCAAGAGAKILGVGMALPGPFDSRHGRIALMSGFPGWDQIDLRHELSDALGLPVFLEHDANCGALAELWYGEHRNLENMLYVVGDRGVGAGIILNGQIYNGISGFTGELGHVSINCFGPRCECGNRGCLELYGSTVALEEEYQRSLFGMWQRGEGQSRTGRINARDICRMVREEDPLAKAAYERTVGYLAFGTVGVINMLNPEAVIFSDKITEGGPFFLDVARGMLKRHLMPDVYNNLIVDTSALQNSGKVRDPMLLGASVLAFENIMEHFPQLLFEDA